MIASGIKEFQVSPDEVLYRFTRQYRITSHSLKHAHGAIRIQPASTLPMLDVDGLAFMAEDPTKPNSDEEQQIETEGWLLRSAFIDLITGLNESLIEACKIVRLAEAQRRSKVQPFVDQVTMDKYFDKVDDELMKASIPTLLMELGAGVKRPLLLVNEIQSINKVRNCLIHRNGLVGRRDVNESAAEVLRLHYLAHRIHVRVGGVEHVVDRAFKAQTHLIHAMKTEALPSTSDTEIGSVIRLSTDLFNDVAYTSILFLQDLRLAVYDLLDVVPKQVVPEIVLVKAGESLA